MAEDLDKYRKLEIDDANLDAELSKQASNYLFVAEKAVRAEMEYELFKGQRTTLEATIDQVIREKAEKDGKKITEAAISKEIQRHPDYEKSEKHLIALRANKELLRALRESWYMRKDMLIQLAVKQRAELECMVGETVKAAA